MRCFFRQEDFKNLVDHMESGDCAGIPKLEPDDADPLDSIAAVFDPCSENEIPQR